MLHHTRSTFRALLPLSAVALLAVAPVSAQTTTPAPGSKPAAATPRPAYRFAVMEFKTADGLGSGISNWGRLESELKNAVADMLAGELVNAGFDVMERQRLGDVLAEQDLGQSGRLDKDTAPEVGKVLGADYLIVGTISEWGMKETNVGGAGNIFRGGLGNIGNAAEYRETQARVKIDFRVVNARTGRVVPGGVGTGQGEEKTRGIGLQRDWYHGIKFDQKEWSQSQIGKATRKSVQEIVRKLNGFTPGDGGAIAARPTVKAAVSAVVSADEFVIDQGEKQGLRKDDVLDILGTTEVKNSKGEVVMKRESAIGVARVVEVQENAAIVKVVSLAPGAPAIKEGDAVRTQSAK